MSSELLTAIIPLSVTDAVEALTQALAARHIELFAVVDHGAGARSVGLELGDEVLAIFGNPAVGTRLMQEDRMTGLDLPLRLLIWAEDGATHIAYSDPHSLANRYQLESSGAVLDGISALMATLAGELTHGREA
jgi:uncharacterized protein (DUF302 family)